MQQRRILPLLFSLLILVSVSTLAAAQIEPRLQAVLSAAAPDETVPVIIRLSEQINVNAYQHLPKKERRRQLVQELKASSGRSQKELRQLLQQAGIRKVTDLWHINALAIDADPALIAIIAARPEVASVSLDGLVALPPVQPAAVASAEWNLAAIGVFDLWQELHPAVPGAGIVVATIDTGVDETHPNLPNWRGDPFDWFDVDQVDPAPSPDDQDGHGTAVMGIIAGSSVGGDAIGVAPGVVWIAANPFAAGDASYADLHSSFAWAIDPDSDPATDDVPDVVNNSWALDAPGSCISEFQSDINLLKTAGIGVIFAAGNSGPDPSTSQSPANNSNTVAVGATDPSGEVAWFSARGPSACDGSVFPQLVAPGVGIRTAFSGGGYGFIDGTSFSAPHIAGVMALLMQAFPDATVAAIETAMTMSADDFGPVGPDSSYGYGLIQAMSAWRYLAGQPILSIHDPSAPENDKHLDFGNVTPQTAQVRNLTLRNAGSSPLSIMTVDDSGLPAEITLDSDPCSNSTLAPGDVCSIALRFSPTDFSTYTGSLTIPSDDPVTGSIDISITGTGNTPPLPATLLAPADGATDVPRPLTFSWAQAADSDGDAISTALLIAVMGHSFDQSTPIVVTTVEEEVNTVLFAGCGLFAVAALLLRRSLRLLIVSVAALLVLSCGGGGGESGSVIAGTVITYQHGGLTANTTYFWKIVSTDARGAVSESPVWHFTTAP